MAEYVLKEDILKYLEKKSSIEISNNSVIGKDISRAIDVLYCDIDNMTPADVQPVKCGYWEEVTDYGDWGDTHYRCSVCGEEWYLEDGKPKDNNMNFCPRCGARMDGDVEWHDTK